MCQCVDSEHCVDTQRCVGNTTSMPNIFIPAAGIATCYYNCYTIIVTAAGVTVTTTVVYLRKPQA